MGNLDFERVFRGFVREVETQKVMTAIPTTQPRVTWIRNTAGPLLVLCVLGVFHAVTLRSSEPIFNGDENRHVMTAVYFHDLLADGGYTNPKRHAEQYYLQYPAISVLIWPPLFHAQVGGTMLVFSTAVEVARASILLMAALALVYFYRLVRFTHDERTAAFATLLCGLSPMVFKYSQYVMLEIPTLAWSMAAIFHFVRAVDEDNSRLRDIYIAAVASAFAALTRFDAVFLLPFFVLVIVAKRAWPVVRSKHTWFAAGIAVALVTPYYGVVMKMAGGLHARQAGAAFVAERAASGTWQKLISYPTVLPEQLGWALTACGILGLLFLANSEVRRRIAIYAALLVAVYITFTPLGEHTPRHTIYWVPAFVVFAATGIQRLCQSESLHRLGWACGMALIAFTAAAGIADIRPAARGYSAAAKFIIEESADSRRVMIDGWLDGNFTYHMRHHDPRRRFTVIRCDKVLYNFLCVPGTDFKQYAHSEADVLEAIYRLGPEFIVVETPQIRERVEIAETLRNILRDHPERFRLEREFPVTIETKYLPSFSLKVYRNLKVNPQPDLVGVEMLGLGRTLSAE